MSTGYGGGLPDYYGESGGGSAGDGRGGATSPGSDPEPYSQAGLSSQDPYAVGPGGTDPYASDPFMMNPYVADLAATDPYGKDPLDADGFGPVFGSSAAASSGGYAVTPYDPSQQYAPQQYGAHPSGPPGYGPYPPPLPSSGAGITGFVLGLLALTMCAGLTAPIGIIFAAIGMKETGPTATDRKGGRGLTIAGLVMSLVGMVPFLFLVLYIVFVIIAIGAGAASS